MPKEVPAEAVPFIQVFTTQFTCFTGTKVQILTPEERRAVPAPASAADIAKHVSPAWGFAGKRDRQSDRETDRQTDKETERQKDRETETETERDRGRDIERQRGRDRERARALRLYKRSTSALLMLSPKALVGLQATESEWYRCRCSTLQALCLAHTGEGDTAMRSLMTYAALTYLYMLLTPRERQMPEVTPSLRRRQVRRLRLY